jgi:hypothetical protein
MNLYRVFYQIGNDRVQSRDFAADSVQQLIFYLWEVHNIADSDIIKIKFLSR